ncbi:hypothetical protein IQ264_06730 [Phormidium sp. LEGE 05292]|uniref:hypothetical protein n=1 Tax=[Phormidium] sp. LEGE 05292 TaxID=767427 RepID=UPI0018814533|nr:hypothetical protein [Phormidium sp. LEGE 05292]MBE9225129.1 hypothetical protein [Phormidium sp. LEGE 05292]
MIYLTPNFPQTLYTRASKLLDFTPKPMLSVITDNIGVKRQGKDINHYVGIVTLKLPQFSDRP